MMRIGHRLFHVISTTEIEAEEISSSQKRMTCKVRVSGLLYRPRNSFSIAFLEPGWATGCSSNSLSAGMLIAFAVIWAALTWFARR
jgi:hypothetical protein